MLACRLINFILLPHYIVIAKNDFLYYFLVKGNVLSLLFRNSSSCVTCVDLVPTVQIKSNCFLRNQDLQVIPKIKICKSSQKLILYFSTCDDVWKRDIHLIQINCFYLDKCIDNNMIHAQERMWENYRIYMNYVLSHCILLAKVFCQVQV